MRAENMPSRPWWYPGYTGPADQAPRGSRRGKRTRPQKKGTLVIRSLSLLVIGAALGVFVAYPFLPDEARNHIDEVQSGVAELVPWSK